MNKKITAIGLSAGLIAGLGAGLALEMSGNAGASNGRSVMVGSNQNSSDPQGMPGGFDQRLQDILKPLVDDGTITQAQADKVIAALQAAGPMGDGGMRGDGGMHGDGGPGGRGMGPGANLDTVASVLGISVDDVRTAVKDGSTIADLAKKNGKSAQDVIDALVAEVKDHFAAEVASGEHTQADADARIAEIDSEGSFHCSSAGTFATMCLIRSASWRLQTRSASGVSTTMSSLTPSRATSLPSAWSCGTRVQAGYWRAL